MRSVVITRITGYLLLLLLLLLPHDSILAESLTQDDVDAIYGNTVFFEGTVSCASFDGENVIVGGPDNAATAFSYFIQKGLSNEQAAGILGNLIAESQVGGNRNLHADNVQDSYTKNTGVEDGLYNPLDLVYSNGIQAGYGIAQWTHISRKERFVAFADATGRPYDSLAMQLDLIWFGMTGEPNVSGASGGMFASTLTGLRDSTTVEEATVVFHGLYEGSSAYQDYINNPVKDEAAYERAFRGRINLAEEAYGKYAGTLSSGIGCEGLTTDGLANTVLAYAWPEWRGRRTDYAMERKPEYKTAVEAASDRSEYVGGADGIPNDKTGVIGVLGVDCGGFVTRVMRDSGYDTEYNFAPRGGSTLYQKQYLLDPNNGWVLVDINSTSDLRPGDVFIRDKNDTGGQYGHTYIYVGDIPGFDSKVASAGVQSRAPVAGDERLIDSRYSVFRRLQ